MKGLVVVLVGLRKSVLADALALKKSLGFVKGGGGRETVEIPERENRFRRGVENFHRQLFEEVAHVFALTAALRLRRRVRNDGLRNSAE
jgi:hypothetical protein